MSFSSSLASYLQDPKMIEKVVTAAFGFFDKDHSGFIEQREVEAVATKVCSLVHMKDIPTSAISTIFLKAAGTDGKVSKAEFAVLVRSLFDHLLHQKPGVAAAAPAAH